MILGDNIFYGHDFSTYLKDASELKDGAITLAIKLKIHQDLG